jgi:predicted metalloendopeptidase
MKQYEFFAKRDGIIFDAKLSLGEDMADISGMAICSEYLRDFHQNNDEITPIRELSFKEFYVYYAKNWRSNQNINIFKKKTNEDEHSYSKYRVNCVLSNSKHFLRIFDVQPGDKMYFNEEEIW